MSRTLSTSVALTLGLVLLSSPGCGGAAGPGAGPRPDTPRSAPPAALVGSWFTGTLSTIQYYDPSSGRFEDPSGTGFYWVFSPDGSYETGAVIDSLVAGCRMRLLGVEAGTTTSDGNSLTIYRHFITTHGTNTCGNGGDRTQGQATRSASFSIETDEHGVEWLTLLGDDGTSERFHRWQ